MKNILWALFGFFALAIGAYPGIYFVVDRKFGLLSSKSPELLDNLAWNIGFYTHIIAGGIALLIGWTQFSPRLRNRFLNTHRNVGKIYIATALLSGLAGFFIGFFATGGPIAAAGFVSLALVWLYTTFQAYRHIRHGRIAAHEQMMLYSYAACFAAVTLRIWLPLLSMAMQDFVSAYRVVAWLCWVPNLLFIRLFYAKG